MIPMPHMAYVQSSPTSKVVLVVFTVNCLLSVGDGLGQLDGGESLFKDGSYHYDHYETQLSKCQ